MVDALICFQFQVWALYFHSSVADFLEELEEIFTVKVLHVNYLDEAEPRKKGGFAMLFDENWYHLKIRKEHAQSTGPVKSLDVSFLEDRLLKPILILRICALIQCWTMLPACMV